MLVVECYIRLNGNPKILEPVFKALKPETLSFSSRRVYVNVESHGNTIALTFKAKDITALRIGLNSYLRWFSAVKRSLETVERFQTVRLNGS